ncbi:MAG: 8-oxo-dGTP diphosphatase [Saprospiraceae bacterium]|jgi:8-oxo-dGTP diphosphatase
MANVLVSTTNAYAGVLVDGDALPTDLTSFESRLTDSISYWAQQQFKVIWLPIKPAFSSYISCALQQGFNYHHTDNNTLMMTKRLQSAALIPPYATHTIGAGAVVINEGKLLAVVERSNAETKPNYFKLPGGMLDRGEHIADGAMREVFEETGIQTQFEGVVCFRHYHVGQFRTSNIYAVCRLEPLSFDIVMDEIELCKAQWLCLDEYFDSPDVGAHNKHIVRAALEPNYLRSVDIEGYMSDYGAYEIFSPTLCEQDV